MMWTTNRITRLILACLILWPVLTSTSYGENSSVTGNRQFRVPAEWEPHAATWMQWPSRYEASMRPAFANIIAVIQAYEPVHVLVRNKREKISAEKLLTSHAVNLDHIT